jgi:hypothetical protein
VAELNRSQEYHLLHGRGWFPDDFVDEGQMRDAWTQHRERLMREFVAANPGRRPFAWWYFEGVPRYGERPVVDQRVRPEYLDREREQKHGLLHTHTYRPIQELEANFLHRNGVLSRHEWELVQQRREAERRRWQEFRDRTGIDLTGLVTE